MGRTVEPPKDVLDYIRLLEKRIANLERSQRIGNTSIDRGNVTVRGGAIVAKHPNGTELFHTGSGSDDDLGEGYLTRIARPNGQTVLEVFSTDTSEGKVKIYDRAGYEMLSDDWLTGRGLSSPTIPINYSPTTEHLAPTNGTSSVDFYPVWTINGRLQHMGIRLMVLVRADAGTAGEMQLREKFFDIVLGETVVISTAQWSYVDITRGMLGDYQIGSTFRLDLEFKVTSGAGGIRSQIVLCHGAPFTF